MFELSWCGSITFSSIISLREYIDLTYMLHAKFNWKDSYKMLCIRTVTSVFLVQNCILKIFILQSCSQFNYHHHHQLIFLIIITLVVVNAYFFLTLKPWLTFRFPQSHDYGETLSTLCVFSPCVSSVSFCHHASHSPHVHAPYFRTWWMLSCAFSHC